MTRLAQTRIPLFTLALALCISGAWFGRGGAQRRAEGEGTTWLSVFHVLENSPIADSVAPPPPRETIGTIPTMAAAAALLTPSTTADHPHDCRNLPARAALPGARGFRATPLPPRGPPNA